MRLFGIFLDEYHVTAGAGATRARDELAGPGAPSRSARSGGRLSPARFRADHPHDARPRSGRARDRGLRSASGGVRATQRLRAVFHRGRAANGSRACARRFRRPRSAPSRRTSADSAAGRRRSSCSAKGSTAALAGAETTCRPSPMSCGSRRGRASRSTPSIRVCGTRCHRLRWRRLPRQTRTVTRDDQRSASPARGAGRRDRGSRGPAGGGPLDDVATAHGGHARALHRSRSAAPTTGGFIR